MQSLTSTSTEKPIAQFPSDWIDPALKKLPKYSLDMAKAAYDRYQRDYCLITSSKRADMVEARLYAEGLQDNTKYKKWNSFKEIDPGTGKEVWKSYVDIDYSVVSPIPKYRNIVLGIFEEEDKLYDIFFNAIDPLSDKERKQEKFKIWAMKQMAEMLQAKQIESRLTQDMGGVMPDTMEELDIFMESCFQLSHEMALKSAVDLSFWRNDWTEVGKMVREDMFDYGVGAVKEYVDKASGQVKIRYANPQNMYLPRTRRKDGKGGSIVGEVVEKTLSQIRAEAGDTFTQADYEKIIKSVAGKNGNPETLFSPYIDSDSDEFRKSNIYAPYDDYKVLVFDLEWLTVDEEYYEEKENEAGEKTIFPAPYGHKVTEYEFYAKRNGKVVKGEDVAVSDPGLAFFKKPKDGGEEIKIQQKEYIAGQKKRKRGVKTCANPMPYGCMWIIGTDLVYNFGKVNDFGRDENGVPNLGYHVYWVTNKSFTQQMMPYADAFMLAWTKIQNAKATASPDGLLIELDALENMSIAGKEFTPLMALAVKRATGDLIYKGTGVNGDPTRHRPVEPAIGGMGKMYQDMVSDINFNIEMIRQVTGFNEIFDSTTPNPETPVRAAIMANQSANKALQTFRGGFESIHQRTAESVARRIQLLARYKKMQGMEYALNGGIRKIIEIGSDISTREYGYKVQRKPTEQQRTKILQDAALAMRPDQTGVAQITYPDYLFITRIIEGGNLQYAEAILAHRIQKRKMEQQAIAERNIQLNGEQQAASNAQAAEAKKAEIMLHAEAEIMVDNNRSANAIKEQQVKTEGLLEVERQKGINMARAAEVNSTAKVISTTIQQEGKKEQQANTEK